MDVFDFFKSVNRMCEHNRCATCPIELYCPISPDDYDDLMAIISTVEDWVKKHPIVTNRQKINEVFGVEPSILLIDNDWLEKEYKAPKEDK